MKSSLIKNVFVVLVMSQVVLAQSGSVLATPPVLRPLIGTYSLPEQNDPSVDTAIREVEQHVESAIVSGDTLFLQSVFSDNFRFTHGDGQITNKTDSLKQIAQRPYLMRRLDGLNIEVHGDVAVTYGLVDITARGDHGNHSYLVKYIRVYKHVNGQWEMLMQRTVDETSSISFDVQS